MNEELLREKVPCAETGIEIRHSMCDICTPGPQCGLDVYVKDGRIIKVEGTEGFPSNNGKLCTRGAATRQYVYRKDRIRTPMKRVDGQLVPVSWDEAYAEVARGLNMIKDRYGAESVAFMCGYPKWQRAFFQRLAYSYGSPNYSTESSACHTSGEMSSYCIYGRLGGMDLSQTDLVILWGSNPYVNAYPMARRLIQLKESGTRFIVIDPRNTDAARKLADVYVRPRIGTDGALAHAMAKVIIDNGWCDDEFIKKYVHGFDKYREYVEQFDLEKAEEITGVSQDVIYNIAKEYALTSKAGINMGTSITHRLNGFNNHRAILSLSVITGKFDRPGTTKPIMFETLAHSDGGFASREHEFAVATKPDTDKPAIGHLRFPLFGALIPQGQGMDFERMLFEETPYQLHGAVMDGVNHMMYPNSPHFLEAMDKLDFTVAIDIFMTDVCKHADVVLPACTSLERGEIKCYAGKFMNYTKPAIEPLYESRDDVTIISEIANALNLDDELLRSGYDKCMQYIMQDSGIEDWEAFKNHDGPVPVPNAHGYEWGSYLKGGCFTPTGKLELYSELVARFKDDYGLNPLPVYIDSDNECDHTEYPFTLCTGARLANAIHTRTHTMPWTRCLRPDASVDINPADAKRLGISRGDDVELVTTTSRITVKANISTITNVGELQFYHGYREANANELIGENHLDPYSGFPGYKQVRCKLLHKEGGES